MAGALGVNQRWLFTSVFALGAALAGLGGALAIPREPANLEIDLALVSDAFVVVVVGGMGSIPGAFLAALLIGEIKAFCIGLGLFRDHAGRRVHRDGGGARPAPLGPPRPAACRGTGGAGGHCFRSFFMEGDVPRRSRACPGAAPLGRLHARPPHRRARVRAVRGQPALPARAGRHGVVRPCRVLRARRLRSRAALSALAATHGGGPARGAAGGGGGRAALRLVLRAPLGNLSRDADARAGADRLVGRIPVGRGDRRLERPGRHLAGRMAFIADRLLLRDLCALRGGDRLPLANRGLALRLCLARESRLAAAR